MAAKVIKVDDGAPKMEHPKIAYDCFGHIVRAKTDAFKQKLTDHYLEQIQPVLDPATGSTSIQVTGKVDMTEMIQSYKDQCGMEMAKKMISQGVDPNVFCDDGQHGGDATGPDNLNDAFQAAQQAQAAAKQAEDALAKMNITKEQALSPDIERIIADAVNKAVAAQQASAPKEDK